jgi:hypothetical protein
MLSEKKIKDLYDFTKKTLINFYAITPECSYNEHFETVVKVYEIVLEIPEKERFSSI